MVEVAPPRRSTPLGGPGPGRVLPFPPCPPPRPPAGTATAPLRTRRLALAGRALPADQRAPRHRDAHRPAPAGGRGRCALRGPDRDTAAADPGARGHSAGRAGAAQAAAARPPAAAPGTPRTGRHRAVVLAAHPPPGTVHLARVGVRAAVRPGAVAAGGAGGGDSPHGLRRADRGARGAGCERRRGGPGAQDLARPLLSARLRGAARRGGPAAGVRVSAGAAGGRAGGADPAAARPAGRRTRFQAAGVGAVPDAVGGRLRGGAPPDRTRSARRRPATARRPVHDARPGPAGEPRAAAGRTARQGP